MDAAETIKSCCAALYEQDWVKVLLGDSFHPGGLKLTERLGEMLGLGPGVRVLDVAAGRGSSALFLARRFGCEVAGTDLSAEMAREAEEAAQAEGLGHLVSFRQGDAERLPFEQGAFDALLCECAFCTFPDKRTAAVEFARVLRPGGRAGISDLTRNGGLPDELESLLAWVACIADARPVEEYARYLREAGFEGFQLEPHDESLVQMVSDIRARLIGAQILAGLKKIALPAGVDLDQAQSIARSAVQAIQEGRLGYALITGERH